MTKFYPYLQGINSRCRSYFLILLFAGLLPFFAQSQCLQKSLKFDGHTNFVDMGGCPSLTVQGALTMEAWINPVTYGNGGIGGVGGMIINNEGQYELSLGADGKLWYALANTSPGWHWTSTDYAIPLNTWTHVALVYDYSSVTDMGEIRVYINGNTTPVYTFLGSGAIVDIYPGSFNPVLDKFNVGCRQNGLNGDFFEGAIDEVRVWKTAVSAANLNQWYHTSVTAAHTQYAGIVGYWKMDEGTGNTTYDALGRNNGNLVNGPVWVAGIDMGPNDCSIPVQIPCGATPVMFSNVQKTDISCAGGNTGTATVTFSGGVAPFKYSLNGGVPVSIPGSPFTITGLSAGTQTIQLIDVFGNSTSTAITIVAGSDNEAPNFSRPADITVYANATCGYNALPAATGDVTNESDNCTTGLQATYTDVVTNGSCGNSRIITRTWHLSDANGNTASDQVQIITVLDITAPTFAKPANTTIFTTANCQYNASPAATGDVTNEADNCSTGLQATYTDVVTNGPCANSKVITRTWHLVDGCGNAAADQVQVITVSDNTPPTFTKPANKAISFTSGTLYDASPAITGDVTNETDNCSTGLQATYTDVVTNSSCGKVINRTWHLADACGNAAADQVQVITVGDNTPPTFTKPANKTIYTTSTCTYNAAPSVTGDVTNEADNSSTGLQATYTDVVTNAACGKVINRTWHLVDGCGNAAADQVQVITVSDNTAPTFTRPADITIPFTTINTYNTPTPATTGDVTNESDNCSTGLQATYTDAVNPCGNTIIITRTWSLVDKCGNKAADQVQTITVSDNATPYIIYAQKEASFAELTAILGAVGVTDAAGKADFKSLTYLPNGYFVKSRNITVACFASIANQTKVAATGGPNPPFFTFAGTTSSLPTYTVSTSTTTPLTANYKYLTIKKNVSVTLKGTLYGTIDIEDGAQVTFDLPGNIVNIENLNVKGDQRLTRVKFTNPTSVRVKTKVDIQNNCRINESGPRVTFYLADDGQDVDKFIVHGKCTWVTANIYMKSGRIRVYDCDDCNPTIMTGWFIAGRVLSQARSVLWNSYGCSSSCYDASNVTRNTAVTEGMLAAAAAQETVTDNAFSLNVYPNPSTTDFKVEVKSGSIAPVLIKITDATGNVVGITPVQKETVVRIGNGLRAGVYFAEVIQGTNRKVIRLVKMN